MAIERPERSGQNDALAPTETPARQPKTAKTLLQGMEKGFRGRYWD